MVNKINLREYYVQNYNLALAPCRKDIRKAKATEAEISHLEHSVKFCGEHHVASGL
jgi:hypothetical protein